MQGKGINYLTSCNFFCGQKLFRCIFHFMKIHPDFYLRRVPRMLKGGSPAVKIVHQ